MENGKEANDKEGGRYDEKKESSPVSGGPTLWLESTVHLLGFVLSLTRNRFF